MTLEDIRMYLTPSVYCTVIDVTVWENKKEIFKGSAEKMVRFRDQLQPEKYQIWSISVDRLRGCLTIHVYKKENN